MHSRSIEVKKRSLERPKNINAAKNKKNKKITPLVPLQLELII